MNKNKEMIVGLVLLAILFGMIYWGYRELLISYENFEFSNITLSTILDRQTQQIWDYEYTIDVVSKRLAQAEALIVEYKKENRKLREKIDLLDVMDDLQGNIQRLKDENRRVLKELESLRKNEQREKKLLDKKITSIQEGRKLIAKHRRKLQHLIQDINQQIHEIRNAEQKERDRIESELGNNGYLMRDGRDCSTTRTYDMINGSVKIDVKFLP